MPATILDAEGNERELKVGDLVQSRERPYRLGRVLDSWQHTIDHIWYADYECALTSNCWTDEVGELLLISSEARGEEKEPTLFTRHVRLRGNVQRAKDAVTADADFRLLQRFRGLLFPSSDHPHRWFWLGVTESLDSTQQVSYASKIEWIDNDNRRMRCSVAKFLKKPSVREMCGEQAFTDAEAVRIGELFGSLMPNDYKYSFVVVSGTEITDAYHEEHAYFGSCMHKKPYVSWYAENPDSVELVRIEQGGSQVGRALLWNTRQGIKVLDRVYPSDGGPHIAAVHKLAEEQGWDYKAQQNFHDGQLKSDRMDYVVRMKASRSGDYPYCDTFKYTDDDPEDEETIHLAMECGDYKFDQTDGRWEGGSARITCRSCDCQVSEDDASSHNGDYYCDGCHGEMFVYLEYSAATCRRDGYYYREDSDYCERCHTDRHSRDFTEVEGEEVCQVCAEAEEEGAVSCVTCGCSVWSENAHENHEGDDLCSECYKLGKHVQCENCNLACRESELPDVFSEEDDKRLRWCPTCRGVQPELPLAPAEPVAEQGELWTCDSSVCAHCRPAGIGVWRSARGGCECRHCHSHRANIPGLGFVLPLYAERVAQREQQRAVLTASPASDWPDFIPYREAMFMGNEELGRLRREYHHSLTRQGYERIRLAADDVTPMGGGQFTHAFAAIS